LIVDPHQAEAIIADGKADLVALARAFLDDPRWAWHAADVLGVSAAAPCPIQYRRARPDAWPGAALRLLGHGQAPKGPPESRSSTATTSFGRCSRQSRVTTIRRSA
jgi:hypothetical protein